MEVTLIDHMGTDLSVVNAARVSFSKESEWESVTPAGPISNLLKESISCQAQSLDSLWSLLCLLQNQGTYLCGQTAGQASGGSGMERGEQEVRGL